jgi:hypothetical protein
MSYGVEGLDGAETLENGTNLLVTGPSTLTEPRLFDAVAPEDGARAIVVTMNLGAERVLEELTDRGADPGQVGIIDCTSHESDLEGAAVRQLASPGDLTGISLEFAKLLDAGEGSMPVRVGFASVSTALMYVELRTMFRFLHVFTARIRSGDMLGIFTMDPAMHEEKAHNTVRAVFDCEATVSENGVELRGTGFDR